MDWELTVLFESYRSDWRLTALRIVRISGAHCWPLVWSCVVIFCVETLQTHERVAQTKRKWRIQLLKALQWLNWILFSTTSWDTRICGPLSQSPSLQSRPRLPSITILLSAAPWRHCQPQADQMIFNLICFFPTRVNGQSSVTLGNILLLLLLIDWKLTCSGSLRTIDHLRVYGSES